MTVFRLLWIAFVLPGVLQANPVSGQTPLPWSGANNPSPAYRTIQPTTAAGRESPQQPTSVPAQQASQFLGDPRLSHSAEAQSMSPPHWGEEPGYWKSPKPLVHGNPLTRRMAPSAQVAKPALPSGSSVAPSSQRFFSPASTDKTMQKRGPNAVYQHIFDPQFLDLFPATNQETPVSPSRGSVQPQFHQPQSIHERGFREFGPVDRGAPSDSGQLFDFENKKREYPPMSEILKTGRYFGMVEGWLLRPSFNSNSVITTQSSTFAQAFQADQTYREAPRLRLGFESKYGPGAEFQYFMFDHNSRPVEGVARAGVNAESSVAAPGLTTPVSVATSSIGQRLVVEQAVEVHSFLLSVFKEVRLPISRVNGVLGARSLSLQQDFLAQVQESTGATSAFLRNQNYFRGYGPHFAIEYYRPIGHTRFEMFGTGNASVLLGHRDQYLNRSNAFQFQRQSLDELVSILEIQTGIQYKYEYAENRNWYLRVAYTNQNWLAGGTPNDPLGDLGFRGIGFSAGVNR